MAFKILILIFVSNLMLAVNSGMSRTTHTLTPCSLDDPDTSRHSFSWQDMGVGHKLPDNAVLGGQNIDTTPLFVARGKGQYRHLYGKLAIRFGNNNAFFGENHRAIETAEFQVLVAKSYVWCYPNEVSKKAKVLDPVCRSTHLGHLCIGQLEGGQCGLSWAADVIFYNHYEVLVIGTECSK